VLGKLLSAHGDCLLDAAQKHLRIIMGNLLNIKSDKDICHHKPTSQEVCEKFKQNEHPGPNIEELQLDLLHPLTCEWNIEVTNLIFGLYRQSERDEGWDVQGRSDEWVKEIIQGCMGRL
jgi:hypothetical protein